MNLLHWDLRHRVATGLRLKLGSLGKKIRYWMLLAPQLNTPLNRCSLNPLNPGTLWPCGTRSSCRSGRSPPEPEEKPGPLRTFPEAASWGSARKMKELHQTQGKIRQEWKENTAERRKKAKRKE